MLLFFLHCSHKLQPLDRSVFGPLKKFINSACGSWMINNPGKTMNIYDIPAIVSTAYPSATTSRNIIAGFKCTGIYPYNSNIFDESDFAPSYVTDRPNPSQPELIGNEKPDNSGDVDDLKTIHEDFNQDSSKIPSTHTDRTLDPVVTCHQTSKSAFHVSPENLKPFPKAEGRKTKGRGRKKMKSCVLTDTPIKSRLEQEKADREKNKKGNGKTTNKRRLNTRKNPKKHKKCNGDEEDDDDAICIVCIESFSNSKPREKWIQCWTCKQWAHEKCTSGGNAYICHNCDSDAADSES